MRIAKVGPCRSLPVDALRTGVVPDTGLDPTPVVTLHPNRAVNLNVNHYGTKEIQNWTSFSPAGSIQLIFVCLFSKLVVLPSWVRAHISHPSGSIKYLILTTFSDNYDS